MMLQFRCSGIPASVFFPSFFLSVSSVFPCHPPTRSVHRSSPCLRHGFIPSVYLYRLSLFPCNILFLTPAIHPARAGLPSLLHFFPLHSPLSHLYISLSLAPEAPQHRPPYSLHMCYRFTPFSSHPS